MRRLAELVGQTSALKMEYERVAFGTCAVRLFIRFAMPPSDQFS